MNYFITFVHQDGDEWCGLITTDKEYVYKVIKDLWSPPFWDIELRCTEEDIDFYSDFDAVDYDVLEISHS